MLLSILILIGTIIMVVFFGWNIFDYWKKENNIKMVICIGIYAILTIGILHLAIFINEAYAIFNIILAALFYWISDIFTKKPQIFLMAVVMIISIIVTAIFEWHIYYTHVCEYDYRISIEDDVVVAEWDRDVEDTGMYIYEVIKNDVKEMKESGKNYHEGRVEIKYSCDFPRYKNMHDEKCRCTIDNICKECREYLIVR